MSVTSLDNMQWVATNNALSFTYRPTVSVSLLFTDLLGVRYCTFWIPTSSDKIYFGTEGQTSLDVTVYTNSQWTSNQYKTLIFAAGYAGNTNSNLINWLEDNGTLTRALVNITISYRFVIASSTEQPDFTIKYKGQTIASSVTGTVTLKTAGKYLEDDIIVGSKTLKTKGKKCIYDIVVTVD